MQKSLFLSLVGLLILNSVAIAGSDGSVTAFMKCARIASDAQRLSCYDRLATEMIELGVSTPADGANEMDVAQMPPTTANAAAPPSGDTAPSADRPVASDAPQVTSDGPGAVASKEEGFGQERVEDAQERDIKFIQSRYVGEFSGWDGNTTFPLENGQVWQQIESGRMSWKATNPMITIKRGFMGSYMLSVEGVNKRVRVKRIK